MPHWMFRGEFCCPHCGAQTSLVEMGTEGVASRISYIERDNRGSYWMDTETLETFSYELSVITCENCGETIAHSHQELGELLEEQGLLPTTPAEGTGQINSVTEID